MHVPARQPLQRVGSLVAVAAVLLSAAPATSAPEATALRSGEPRPDMVDAAEAAAEWSPAWPPAERAETPPDRYAMAGGCYAVWSTATGRYLARHSEGFAASAADLDSAEPFRFQATDLGSYLLFGAGRDFLAASEGTAGQALGRVTDNPVGAAVGGVTMETTDQLTAELAAGPPGEATGRGERVGSAEQPSELADWEIDQTAAGFRLGLPVLTRVLVAGESGELGLADAEGAGGAAEFGLQLTTGCATFPEVEVNVDGDPHQGPAAFGEVTGYLDAHLHMMAFEFLGGRARCGRPWHRYGAEHALRGCQEHELAGGRAALLETFLSGRDPVAGHDTNAGWPTFTDWPEYNSLTYEQVYYRWLERAWRGGLRMFVNLLVDNNKLCQVYPYKRNSCNEMDGVRLQEQRIRELERYIDAQNGGPGRGWFRVVADPFTARRVMNAGKLAVVLGIELSVPFDCGVFLDVPLCNFDQIDEALEEVYGLGVRQMEIVNKFDNALTGVAGDAGELGLVVGFGNFLETGRWWQMENCEDAHDHGHGHDRQQMNIDDDAGTPEELTGRDALVGIILAETGRTGAAPLYPPGPHCNRIGLTVLGEHVIRRMIDKGMIFDPDHMSARARAQAMDLIEAEQHPGVVSSHSWADETIYPRILAMGGVVTPYAGDSTSFVDAWRTHQQWIDERFYFGFGYGADTNGFGTQGRPRGADADDPVTYPFRGLGGVVIDQQTSGERVYDVNVDGVAHYGLYPDWLEDLRRIAGDEILDDMARGPEAYLQMWERSVGVAPDSCRPDVPGLTGEDLARVQPGMTPEQVLLAVGQPASRQGDAFTYCLADGRIATVGLEAGVVAAAAAPEQPGRGDAVAVVPVAGLPATGGAYGHAGHADREDREDRDGVVRGGDQASGSAPGRGAIEADAAAGDGAASGWLLLLPLVALLALAAARRRGMLRASTARKERPWRSTSG